jgi:diguanylate cyclase (GGDEF)-like protein
MLRIVGRAERRRQRELIRRANHDTLTGLPNRQRMTTDFSVMQRRHGNSFSLLFIDMDNFKSINDGFGHVQGDALLQQLGERLRAFARPAESVARIGGDEFVLLTPEIEAEPLLERAHDLIERMAAYYTVNGVRCELGCSVGIATTTEAGTSLSDMLRAADIAMYAAKKERNSARFYEPSMGGRYLRSIRIEQNLKGAVDHGLVRTVYQPQVGVDGHLVGFEALARWHDAELGSIEPRRFIPVAEASGFIGALGDYILERCLDDARLLEARQKHPLRLAINVSVRQFRQTRFAERFIERVERAALDRTRLVVEITENLFMDDHGLIMHELEQLRMAGVRVSLDDFGTGFSSLGLLRSLPVDELKIDKSFIDNLAFDPAARNLVQSMVAIAKNHGMVLVAEGVETAEQFEILRDDGCDVFQGFLFAKPMERDQVLDYLGNL